MWGTFDIADQRWYIPVVIMTGGLLIALLRPHAADITLNDQLTNTDDIRTIHRKRIAFLGLLALISVGFGGAIGPEAGLIGFILALNVLRLPHESLLLPKVDSGSIAGKTSCGL